MKKITLILCFLAFLPVTGQHFFIELGRVNSSFDFTNSQGQELQNLQSQSNSYAGIGYKQTLFTEKLNVSLGLNYNSYGATGSDISLGNSFEWEVDYIGVNLNFDYDLASIGDFTLFAKAGVALEFLATGTQRINNVTIDLVKEEEFDQNPFFFRAGAGVSYPIFKGGSLYAQYLWGKSLPLKDDNGGSSEELVINTHMFGLGLVVDILKKENQNQETETETQD